jgi:hypothetical protein
VIVRAHVNEQQLGVILGHEQLFVHEGVSKLSVDEHLSTQVNHVQYYMYALDIEQCANFQYYYNIVLVFSLLSELEQDV